MAVEGGADTITMHRFEEPRPLPSGKPVKSIQLAMLPFIAAFAGWLLLIFEFRGFLPALKVFKKPG